MSFISGWFFLDIPRGKILKQQQSQVISSMNSIIHTYIYIYISIYIYIYQVSTLEIIPAKVLLILCVALISSQVYALWLESAESGVRTFFSTFIIIPLWFHKN